MKSSRRFEADFIKPKLPFSSLTLIVGIALEVFCLYGIMKNDRAATGVIVGAVFGALIIAASIFGLRFNRGAFLTIDGTHITAKYYWFARLDCDTSDIRFVMSQTNTLMILLKDGKRHMIMGISNAERLCVELQKSVSFETQDSPEVIAKELATVKKTRRTHIIYFIAAFLAAFLILVLTIILTGGKDFPDFSTRDWIIFWAMAILIIFPLVATFWAANNAGRMLLDINLLQYSLRRKIIETTYLPPRKIKAVLTDKDFMGRIIVYENHDSKFVIISEEMNSKMELERSFQSEPLDEDDFNALMKDRLQYTIDITNIYV